MSPPMIVRAKVNILETLKGSGREPSSVEGGANYRDAVCNIALVTGAEYLFVLESTPVVSSCNSWFLDGDPAGEKMLQQFRSLKEGR